MAKCQKIFSTSGHPSQNEEDYCLIPCINKIFDGAIIWFIFWKMRQNWKLWFEKEMQLLSNFTKSLYPLCYIVTHCKKKFLLLLWMLIAIITVWAKAASLFFMSWHKIWGKNLNQQKEIELAKTFQILTSKGLYLEKTPARAVQSFGRKLCDIGRD